MLAHKCETMENMNISQEPQPKTVPRKHKGGRPPLSDDEKHIYYKKVYYTKEECERIEQAAEANNMSASEYIAQMSLNGKVVAPVSPEFAGHFRAVASMSNNINQLAHQANRSGYYAVANELHGVIPQLRGVLTLIYDGV